VIEGPQLLIVIAVLVLFFGSKRLPDLARSLGEAQRELKRGLSEGSDDVVIDPVRGTGGDSPAEGSVVEAVDSSQEVISVTRAELDRLVAEGVRRAESRSD